MTPLRLAPLLPFLLLFVSLLPAAHAGTPLDPEASDPQDAAFAPADLRALWLEEDGKALVLSMRLDSVPDPSSADGVQAAQDALQFSLRFHERATAWEWRETLKTIYLPDGTPGLQVKDELLANGTNVGPAQDPVGDAQAFPGAVLGTSDPAYTTAQDAATGVRSLRFLHSHDRIPDAALLMGLAGSVRSLADDALNTVACGAAMAMDCADAPALAYQVGTPPPLPGVRAAAANLTVAAGGAANATLLLNNTDTASHDLGFLAAAPPGWQVRFEPATLALAAGARAAVQVRVAPPANATGTARLLLEGFESGKAATAPLAVEVAPAPPAPPAPRAAPTAAAEPTTAPPTAAGPATPAASTARVATGPSPSSPAAAKGSPAPGALACLAAVALLVLRRR